MGLQTKSNSQSMKMKNAAAPGSSDFCFNYNGKRYCIDFSHLRALLTGY